MIRATLGLAVAAGAALTLSACELSPKVSQQTGYRGTAQAQINTEAARAKLTSANFVPPPVFPLDVAPDSPRATEIYQNVQVLGDLSADEFNHLMASITAWVSPEQGCNYCHNPENLASDEVYTKVVARRMIQMNRAINGTWSNHVKQTGVTCWTCHRGQPVPANTWSMAVAEPDRLMGNKRGGQTPIAATGYSSLPYDPFALIGKGSGAIRVQTASAFPVGNPKGTMDAEHTFSLMIHMSKGLGVNCTYCHNSRAFAEWDQSAAPRTTAWYGLRMTGNINSEYIDSLKGVFPANRVGPAGDPLKANCATCHQGARKPLNGKSMLPDHPYLGRVAPPPTPLAATPVAAADTPADVTSSMRAAVVAATGDGAR